MRAWISPLRTSRLRPLRISLPSTATWRSRTSSSGVWLMPCPSPGLGREALAAGAAVAHVRVVELEARSHQSGDEIHLGAAQQDEALRVHDQPHAVALEHLITGRFRFAE